MQANYDTHLANYGSYYLAIYNQELLTEVRESIQLSIGMYKMCVYSNYRYYHTHLCFENVSKGEKICFTWPDRFNILICSIHIYAHPISLYNLSYKQTHDLHSSVSSCTCCKWKPLWMTQFHKAIQVAECIDFPFDWCQCYWKCLQQSKSIST